MIRLAIPRLWLVLYLATNTNEGWRLNYYECFTESLSIRLSSHIIWTKMFQHVKSYSKLCMVQCKTVIATWFARILIRRVTKAKNLRSKTTRLMSILMTQRPKPSCTKTRPLLNLLHRRYEISVSTNFLTECIFFHPLQIYMWAGSTDQCHVPNATDLMQLKFVMHCVPKTCYNTLLFNINSNILDSRYNNCTT